MYPGRVTCPCAFRPCNVRSTFSNEGYHGASPESAVRAELCREAMRLAGLSLDPCPAARAATRALSALMCFHAARLPARVDAAGDLRPLFEQDRSRWDVRVIAEGQRQLDLSATGPELTEYHVEAAIAWVHAAAHGVEDRKSTRLNSSHGYISYAVFCLKKKKTQYASYCSSGPAGLSSGDRFWKWKNATMGLKIAIQTTLTPAVLSTRSL